MDAKVPCRNPEKCGTTFHWANTLAANRCGREPVAASQTATPRPVAAVPSSNAGAAGAPQEMKEALSRALDDAWQETDEPSSMADIIIDQHGLVGPSGDPQSDSVALADILEQHMYEDDGEQAELIAKDLIEGGWSWPEESDDPHQFDETVAAAAKRERERNSSPKYVAQAILEAGVGFPEDDNLRRGEEDAYQSVMEVLREEPGSHELQQRLWDAGLRQNK